MTTAEKLIRAKEDLNAVYEVGYTKGQAAGGDTEGAYNEGYEAGQEAENARFWDAITCNGTRTDYTRCFTLMGAEELKPPIKIIPLNLDSMFYYAPNLKRVSAKYFDFTQANVKTDNRVNRNIFTGCKNLEDLSEMEFPAGGYGYTFYQCRKLHSIGVVNAGEDDVFVNVFSGCNALENLTIKGTIGQNGFNVSSAKLLTHNSLMSIINALKDYSDSTSTYTITLGKDNLNKLTDAEKAIAIEKGWSLA